MDMNPPPHDMLGHYQLGDQIGQGGMGAVYRAHDTRLNRSVAVKLWHQSGADSASATRRLLREARAASALNHPNIVIIHEVGETPDGDQFMVQEFIEGRTLRELGDAGVELAPLLDIAVQVARALGAAHAAGIVHRDIKPENVMVRADGYVKVLDFGIAVMPKSAEATTSVATFVTGEHGLMGTPAYLSPEQALGETVGSPADVFSLGVVLYELATGQRPFGGPTVLSVISSIATAEPVLASRVAPDLPQKFADLLHWMLEKAAERRPTVAEVEGVLADCIKGMSRATSRTVASASATVGREAELAQLDAVYARVSDGRSAMIGIAGEPGIGKSSLLDDFLAHLEALEVRPTIARARCSENLAGADAYLPVLEALDSLRGRGARGRGNFDTLIQTVAPTWAAQMLSGAAKQPESEEAGRSPAVSQERMKRELSALLQDLSRRAPLVWVIDDLHWADVSTIDMLSYLSGHFAQMQILVVLCFRPADMALVKHSFLRVRRELQTRGIYEEIALGFLSVDDVERYLTLHYPGHRFEDEFVRAIHARTEGSPLFMVDLVRYLRDTGNIEQDTTGSWAVAGSLPVSPTELPESVRGMISRKIERLDETDRKLLLAASVQGQEFDASLVSEALQLDPADVEDHLAVLESIHVLVQREVEHEYPDQGLTARYRFVHVLYQNVLYASLQPARRASLAGHTARALATHYGGDTSPVALRLAVLFEAARDFSSAAQHFYLAANRAASRFGFREALSLTERGLSGLANMKDGPARQQLELGLQMVRGLALRSVKGWAAEELEPTFARARQLCQQLDDPPALFPVLWNLAFFNMIRGNLAVVREQLVTLDAQAKAADEPAFLMSASHVAGVTNEFAGDVVKSSELLEQSRVLHEPARHEAYNAMFGIDPGMVARAMSSRPLWARGFPDQARARSRETIALGRSQRQPVTLVFALIVSEGIHVFRGEAAEAVALGDETIAMCREYEFPQEAEWARAFRGAALAQMGRVEDGVTELKESLAALEALRSGLVRTMFLSLLAEAYWRADRVDEGLGVIREGFAHAERTLEHGFLHELHRLQGECFRRAGRTEEAHTAFQQALKYAVQQSAKSFELRAATSYARLLIAEGRRAEAHALVAPVYGWFTEGFTTADLIAAQELLSHTS